MLILLKAGLEPTRYLSSQGRGCRMSQKRLRRRQKLTVWGAFLSEVEIKFLVMESTMTNNFHYLQ